MKSKFKPLSRKQDIVTQELKDELLIYDLVEHKAFCLNETSAMIWQFCDGNKSVAEINLELSKKLKSPVSEDFVWLALDKLKKENLLDNGNEIDNKFNGLSRREVIRKVGLASMAALPVISILTAPTAAQSASLVAPNGYAGNYFTAAGNSCADFTDAEKTATCNSLYSSVCSSQSAKYKSGTCRTLPSDPNFNGWDCVCV